MVVGGGVYPPIFSKVERDTQTPLLGTLILAALCLFGLLLRAVSPTVNSEFGSLIDDIGVLVAFYYGAAGIACAWHSGK